MPIIPTNYSIQAKRTICTFEPAISNGVRTGRSGKGSAIVWPGEEGTITFQNVDGDLWKDKKVLDIWLKGDGQPGPITAYLAFQSQYYVEIGKGNYTEVDLVPKGQVFTPGWHEYAINLDHVKNRNAVSQIFLDPNKRRLQIGPIYVK